MTFDPKTLRRTHEFSTNARQAMSELVSKLPHSRDSYCYDVSKNSIVHSTVPVHIPVQWLEICCINLVTECDRVNQLSKVST